MLMDDMNLAGPLISDIGLFYSLQCAPHYWGIGERDDRYMNNSSFKQTREAILEIQVQVPPFPSKGKVPRGNTSSFRQRSFCLKKKVNRGKSTSPSFS